MGFLRLGAAAGAALLLAIVAARQASRAERWQVIVARDQASALLSLPADAPVQGWTRRAVATLVVKCQSGVRQIAVASQLPIEVERRSTRSVRLQFDDDPAQLVQWILADDRETLIEPEPDMLATTERLASAQRLDVAFVPLRSEPAIARFSVAGFSRVRDRVAQCFANGVSTSKR